MKKWKKLTAAFLVANYAGVYEATPVFDVKAALFSAAGYLEKDGQFFCNAVRLNSGGIVSAEHCDQPYLSNVKFVQYAPKKKEKYFNSLRKSEFFSYQHNRNIPDMEDMLLNDRISYGVEWSEDTLQADVGTVGLGDLSWSDHDEYKNIEQAHVISFAIRPHRFYRVRSSLSRCHLYRHKDYKDITLSDCKLRSGDSGSGLYYDRGQLGLSLVAVRSGLFSLGGYIEKNPFWEKYYKLNEEARIWNVYTPIEDVETSASINMVQRDQCLRVVSEGGLNLRYGPGTEYDKNGAAIPFNHMAKIIYDYNDLWSKIETEDGREGYVATRYTTDPFSCDF